MRTLRRWLALLIFDVGAWLELTGTPEYHRDYRAIELRAERARLHQACQ